MTTSKCSQNEKEETDANNAYQDFDDDADLKIILLGDSAVGKSKLIERYLMQSYEPRQLSTYALTVYRHVCPKRDLFEENEQSAADVDVDNEDNNNNSNGEGNEKQIKIDFWDTAGQERFSSMHPAYYFKAHACILVFDVTRKLSYQNLNAWHKELKRYRPCIPVIVVANKIDMDYNVTKKKFKFATKRQFPLEFTSAADGTNVVKVFKDAIQLAQKYKEKPGSDLDDEILKMAASLT